eukprot:s1600_g4.t3
MCERNILPYSFAQRACLPEIAVGFAAMSVLLAAAFNIVSSVSIILVNKQIASVCRFDFILTMLFLNFLTTASLLEVLAKLQWFEKKHLPMRERWLIAGIALSTVLLNNCSNELLRDSVRLRGQLGGSKK